MGRRPPAPPPPLRAACRLADSVAKLIHEYLPSFAAAAAARYIIGGGDTQYYNITHVIQSELHCTRNRILHFVLIASFIYFYLD